MGPFSQSFDRWQGFLEVYLSDLGKGTWSTCEPKSCGQRSRVGLGLVLDPGRQDAGVYLGQDDRNHQQNPGSVRSREAWGWANELAELEREPLVTTRPKVPLAERGSV